MTNDEKKVLEVSEGLQAIERQKLELLKIVCRFESDDELQLNFNVMKASLMSLIMISLKPEGWMEFIEVYTKVIKEGLQVAMDNPQIQAAIQLKKSLLSLVESMEKKGS